MVKKILVVDDDSGVRKLVKIMLGGRGYEVTEADSGIRCMEILNCGERPDLILLDVMMPRLDGWETCKRIRGLGEPGKIVIAMLTSKDLDMDKIKSLESAEADWHISKPIVKDKFLRTVEWLVNKDN